jgi:hypothetical protein
VMPDSDFDARKRDGNVFDRRVVNQLGSFERLDARGEFFESGHGRLHIVSVRGASGPVESLVCELAARRGLASRFHVAGVESGV